VQGPGGDRGEEEVHVIKVLEVLGRHGGAHCGGHHGFQGL